MVATDGGYLFAHMTDENYARLFYSTMSRDAFHWETLNTKWNRVAGLLRPSGHLLEGAVSFMIGVQLTRCYYIVVIFWSGNLSDKLKSLFNKISDLGYKNEETYYGAQMFGGTSGQIYHSGMPVKQAMTGSHQNGRRNVRIFDIGFQDFHRLETFVQFYG